MSVKLVKRDFVINKETIKLDIGKYECKIIYDENYNKSSEEPLRIKVLIDIYYKNKYDELNEGGVYNFRDRPFDLFMYKNNLYKVDTKNNYTEDQMKLMVKHHCYKEDEKFQKIKKEIELLEKFSHPNFDENEPDEPNVIIFNVERPNIRDLDEIGANVKLWTPKDNPKNKNLYIFHRDGPDGRIGTVPCEYARIIIAHIRRGLEYKAEIIELGFNKCKIKCRLISKEITELRKSKAREVLRAELTKPYNPRKPIILVLVMEEKLVKVGDKLIIEFDDIDSYVHGQGNIKFLNQTGDSIGREVFDGKDKIWRLVKAHSNSFLFDVEVLNIEKDPNDRFEFLVKLLITAYKK